MSVTTPFNENQDATLIKEYDSIKIIKEYADDLNMDVSGYFKGVDNVFLYESAKSKIRFFRPISTMGDSAFYEQLQQYDWYYMDWKWEQQHTLELLKPTDKVLEIGSGKGNFVHKLTTQKISVQGVEMNEKEVEIGTQKGLNITNQSLEDLIQLQAAQFDVICSFQVFEHVPDLDTIIKQSVQLLKPGGKLIFSVPNMDAFIKITEGGVLNFPPHHVNWFYKSTFQYIAEKYNIKLQQLDFEPLQSYHYNWYAEYIKIKYLNSSVLQRIFYSKIGRKLTFSLIKNFANKIKGHSVLAVYQKPF